MSNVNRGSFVHDVSACPLPAEAIKSTPLLDSKHSFFGAMFQFVSKSKSASSLQGGEKNLKNGTSQQPFSSPHSHLESTINFNNPTIKQAKITKLQKAVAKITNDQSTLTMAARQAIEKKVTVFTTKEEFSIRENYASGNMARVAFIQYRNGQRGIFKPVNNDHKMDSLIAGVMGIPLESTLRAGLAERAVATFRIDKLLGSDLVPETDFARHQEEIGSLQLFAEGHSLYKEKIVSFPDSESVEDLALQASVDGSKILPAGWELIVAPPLVKKNETSSLEENGAPLTWARAEELYNEGKIELGKKAVVEVMPVDFSNPSLQKAMSKAHLLDLLTGQLDRNPGNFFYEQLDDGRYALHLIDNDLSFPAKFSDFSETTMSQLQGAALKKLPRLLDQEMAEQIASLDPISLSEVLRKAGLHKNEIQSAVARLKALQEYIKNIRSGKILGGCLVSTWDEKTFLALQEQEDNYTFRSMADMQGLLEQRGRVATGNF